MMSTVAPALNDLTITLPARPKIGGDTGTPTTEPPSKPIKPKRKVDPAPASPPPRRVRPSPKEDPGPARVPKPIPRPGCY